MLGPERLACLADGVPDVERLEESLGAFLGLFARADLIAVLLDQRQDFNEPQFELLVGRR